MPFTLRGQRVKITRMREIITNLRSSLSGCKINSPSQYLRKCLENSMENKQTDCRMYSCRGLSQRASNGGMQVFLCRWPKKIILDAMPVYITENTKILYFQIKMFDLIPSFRLNIKIVPATFGVILSSICHTIKKFPQNCREATALARVSFVIYDS